jgi:predicted ester cyclase
MPTYTGAAEEIAMKAMDIYDNHEFDRIGEVLTDDYEVKVAGATFNGLEEMREMLNGFYGAFPDLEHHIEAVVGGNDDEVCLEIRVTATHNGTYVGAPGEIAATGNAIEWFSGNVIRTRGDKLASWHIYLDQVPVLAQMGYTFPRA